MSKIIGPPLTEAILRECYRICCIDEPLNKCHYCPLTHKPYGRCTVRWVDVSLRAVKLKEAFWGQHNREGRKKIQEEMVQTALDMYGDPLYNDLKKVEKEIEIE